MRLIMLVKMAARESDGVSDEIRALFALAVTRQQKIKCDIVIVKGL